MNTDTKPENVLGPPHASTGVPHISIEGPNDLPAEADIGNNNTQDAKFRPENPSPGMLEAGGASGANLKKRNLTGNNHNNLQTPARSPTGLTGKQDDIGWFRALLHPKHDPDALQPPSAARCFMNILKYSYLNVLLLMIPIGWAVHFAKLNDTLIFVFNFLAIVPLAALLGFATEELALRVGPTLGGMDWFS
jgi:Ca2+:H+ antiporter